MQVQVLLPAPKRDRWLLPSISFLTELIDAEPLQLAELDCFAHKLFLSTNIRRRKARFASPVTRTSKKEEQRSSFLLVCVMTTQNLLQRLSVGAGNVCRFAQQMTDGVRQDKLAVERSETCSSMSCYPHQQKRELRLSFYFSFFTPLSRQKVPSKKSFPHPIDNDFLIWYIGIER